MSCESRLSLLLILIYGYAVHIIVIIRKKLFQHLFFDDIQCLFKWIVNAWTHPRCEKQNFKNSFVCQLSTKIEIIKKSNK